jgi:dTDP-4-amino-4,6-dideoxygalactose transaminase
MSISPKSAAPRRASLDQKVTAARPVPLLDLQRQFAHVREEVMAAVERVCSSQQFILGEEVAHFERDVSSFTGAGFSAGCASGTDAVWLALAACGIQPGDVVMTTPFSFFASASAIVRAGARPVFVDIDPHSFNLDPHLVATRLHGLPSVRAIIPVHLYGQCADMDAFRRIGSQFNVSVIEDAAQAFGAGWRGQRAGALGRAAAFSFYPTKNLSAFGDAGCITTSDAAVVERARSLRNHGSTQRYYHQEIGWNSRLDAIQAAILRVKMGRVQQWNEQRRQRAATYDQLFRKAGLADARGDHSAPLCLPSTRPEAYHIFHQYVIRAQQRDALREFLTKHGIGTEIYYPLPLHLQPCFSYLGYRDGDFPQAEQASQEVLALPMFPELTAEEQQCVVETIAQYYS